MNETLKTMKELRKIHVEYERIGIEITNGSHMYHEGFAHKYAVVLQARWQQSVRIACTLRII